MDIAANEGVVIAHIADSTEAKIRDQGELNIDLVSAERYLVTIDLAKFCQTA